MRGLIWYSAQRWFLKWTGMRNKRNKGIAPANPLSRVEGSCLAILIMRARWWAPLFCSSHSKHFCFLDTDAKNAISARRRRHWRSSTIQGAWEFLRLRMHKKLNNSFAALESRDALHEKESHLISGAVFFLEWLFIYPDRKLKEMRTMSRVALLSGLQRSRSMEQYKHRPNTGSNQRVSIGVIKITRSWGRKSIGFDRMESSSHTWRSHHQKFINGKLLDRLQAISIKFDLNQMDQKKSFAKILKNSHRKIPDFLICIFLQYKFKFKLYFGQFYTVWTVKLFQK